MITYDLDVFIGRNKPEKMAVVKCHDTGVCLRVHLKTEKKVSKWRTEVEPYAIPAGTTPVIKIEKPDKKYVIQDGTSQGAVVFVKLPPQSFTVAGTASAEINLFDKDGRRITTDTFLIEVPKEVADDCAKDSETYVSLMAAQIQAAVDAAERAEAAAERAEAAGGGGGGGGEAGGYYSPTVTQPTPDTMELSFEPSAAGMPAIDPVRVTLPAGPAGSDGKDGKDGEPGKDGADGAPGKDGADGYTPRRGVDYYTEADQAEMVATVVAALPVYNGEVESV